MSKKNVLLLNGSPKIKGSTSVLLGEYLTNELYQAEYSFETMHILSEIKKDINILFEKINDADVVVLSFPLYVDTLPSHVIKFFELSKDYRKNVKKQPQFIAIGNCGFPEAVHNKNALLACKQYAKDNHFNWLGGTAVGGGAALAQLSDLKDNKMTKKIRKGLDQLIDSILHNRVIYSNEDNLVYTKFAPSFLYVLVSHLSFKKIAKQLNIKKDIYNKPYLK